MPGGNPACANAGAEGVLDDRLGGPQGVRSDPHHDGVAGAHHTGGVGEDIRAALEHEADNSQRRAAGIDRPAVVGDRAERHVAAQRRGFPPAQAGDHVVEHPLREDQAGRRAAGRSCRGDVTAIGLEDRANRRLVAEPVGEAGKEPGDVLVADATERHERLGGRVDRGDRGGVLGRGDVQQVARLGDGDEAVAGPERSGQLGADRDVSIRTDEDHLPWLETLEGQRTAHPASVGCCL